MPPPRSLAFVSEDDDSLRLLPEKLSLADSGSLIHKNMLRRPQKLMPSVHTYLAGFPCQPESTQGNRSMANPALAGVIRYVFQSKPLSFIIENVKGLIVGRKQQRRFDRMLKLLRRTHIADVGVQLTMPVNVSDVVNGDVNTPGSCSDASEAVSDSDYDGGSDDASTGFEFHK